MPFVLYLLPQKKHLYFLTLIGGLLSGPFVLFSPCQLFCNLVDYSKRIVHVCYGGHHPSCVLTIDSSNSATSTKVLYRFFCRFYRFPSVPDKSSFCFYVWAVFHLGSPFNNNHRLIILSTFCIHTF